MLEPRRPLVAIAIAIPGIAGCTLALAWFLWKIVDNRLPWTAGQSAREHYLAVGGAYGDGFVTGFFLCFFLVVLGAGAVAWLARRRPPRGVV